MKLWPEKQIETQEQEIVFSLMKSPGACCIGGECDPSKENQEDCASAGGTWVEGKSCDDDPCSTVMGTLSGPCPGGEFPCAFFLSSGDNTASISCDAYGVSLSWDGSSWSITSAPCGPHDVLESSFNPEAKTMSAQMYDNGCSCEWAVTVP